MSVLRVYDRNECDERGVPLDWERCRACGGTGKVQEPGGGGLAAWASCLRCDGHGNLKAAALAAATERQGTGNHPVTGVYQTPRCEDCGHPMSDGTWEGERKNDVWDRGEAFALEWITRCLAADPSWEPDVDYTHYSRCDEGCRHGGPGRINLPGGEWAATTLPVNDPDVGPEASWRPVDVRTLNEWAHDLRPENLAVLCLRCWAGR